MKFEPGTRAWFVVISSEKLVEILDGPFATAFDARTAAQLNALDGSTGAHPRLRYVPRSQTWIPIYGPRHLGGDDDAREA